MEMQVNFNVEASTAEGVLLAGDKGAREYFGSLPFRLVPQVAHETTRNEGGDGQVFNRRFECLIVAYAELPKEGK